METCQVTLSNITAALPSGRFTSTRAEMKKERIMFAIFFLYWISVPQCFSCFFFLLLLLLLGSPRLMEVKCYPSTNKERL